MDMGFTAIEWPDWTWNPVWGCKRKCKTPAGEVYCYAWGIDEHHPNPHVPDFGIPTLMKAIDAEIPRSVKCIFVNSMSDVCYWQPEWLERVIARIKGYPDKYFVFLTKDYEFYRKHIYLMNLPNVMLGYTATNEAQYEAVVAEHDRLMDAMDAMDEMDKDGRPVVRQAHHDTSGAKLVLNIEPMFDPVPDYLVENLWDWVIVGPLNKHGRSKYIPKEWLEPIIREAKNKLYPLFMKNGFKLMHNWGDDFIQEKPEYCKKLKIESFDKLRMTELKMRGVQPGVAVLQEADQITLFDSTRNFED